MVLHFCKNINQINFICFKDFFIDFLQRFKYNMHNGTSVSNMVVGDF